MAETHNPILSTRVIQRWRLSDELPQPAPGRALVLLQAGKPLRTLRLGERLTANDLRWGSEKTLYEVDTTEHTLVCRCSLPGAGPTCLAVVQVAYQVSDPGTIVSDTLTDARAVLEPWLVATLGRVSRGYGPQHLAAAERAMQDTLQRTPQHRGFTLTQVGVVVDRQEDTRQAAEVFRYLEQKVQGVSQRFSPPILQPMEPPQRSQPISPEHAWDAVIRRVSGKVPLRAGETLVCVQANTKKIVVSKLQWLKRNLRYYVVSSTEWGDRSVESKTEPILLSDFTRNREIAVIVAFRVSCPPGQETRLAQAVSHTETPQEALHGAIAHYVHEFVRQDDIGACIDKYYDGKKQALGRFVEDTMRQHFGVDFAARLTLRYEEQLAVSHIVALPVTVTLTDSDEEHQLTVSADLEIHPHQQMQAILHYPHLSDLEQRVQRAVRAFFAEHVTVHACYYEMTMPAVQRPLRAMLQTLLEREGRTLGRLSVEVAAQEQRVEPFVPMTVDIPHTPYGSTAPITIKNDLQLVLRDYGQYKRAGSPALLPWVRETLATITAQVFFGKTYVEILLHFPAQAAEVKRLMGEATQRMGFTLHHLVTKTDMKENDFQDFQLYTFQCPELPTGEASITVSLQVRATLKISDLNNLAHLLNQNRDVHAAMETSIQGVLAQQLHQVDAETVYMKYDLSTDAAHPSLQDTLVACVTRHLAETYCAEVTTVALQWLDNAITRHIKAMMYKLSTLRLAVLPLAGVEQLNFQGNFRVTAVHPQGWGRFRQCDFTLDDLRTYCETALVAELKTVSQQALRYTTAAHREQLEEIVNTIAREAVAEQYGVMIQINNFDREDTASRQALAASAENEQLQKIGLRNKEVEALVQKRLQELEAQHMTGQSALVQQQRLLQAQEDVSTSTHAADEKDRATYEQRLAAMAQGTQAPAWSPPEEPGEGEPDQAMQELAQRRARKRLAPKAEVAQLGTENTTETPPAE